MEKKYQIKAQFQFTSKSLIEKLFPNESDRVYFSFQRRYHRDVPYSILLDLMQKNSRGFLRKYKTWIKQHIDKNIDVSKLDKHKCREIIERHIENVCIKNVILHNCYKCVPYFFLYNFFENYIKSDFENMVLEDYEGIVERFSEIVQTSNLKLNINERFKISF